MPIPYERSPDADPNTESDPSGRPLPEQDPENDRELGGGDRRGPGYSEPDQDQGDAWRRQPNREDE
jgi:hypothetical protein